MPSEVTELLRPLRAAYYTSVRDIALDIIRDLTDKRKEDGQDWSSADVIREADLSDVYDAITGYVDGCSWVIFTKSAEAVVIVSDNRDAADDTESPTVETRAACTMVEDVREAIEAFAEHPEVLADAMKPAKAKEVRQ